MTVSPKAEITNQFHYVQRAKRVKSHWNNVPRGTRKVIHPSPSIRTELPLKGEPNKKGDYKC